MKPVVKKEDVSKFFTKLKNIYDLMDQKYNEVAEHYEFQCKGCEDNCCLSRFYHHTYIEYYFIHEGFNKLDTDKQNQIKNRAVLVDQKTVESEVKGEPLNEMCPLNFDGLCILYKYRPMICRLHGLSHELRKPGFEPVKNSGCGLFMEVSNGKEYYQFDRTPFYIKMAELENEFKKNLGLTEKIKKTIAGMIITSAFNDDKN